MLIQGCDDGALKKESLKTEYHGILLANNSGFFGKIEKMESKYIELSDVYFVVNQQNPDTKQVDSRLVKKGKEAHNPDRMFINMQYVVSIEPVAADSKMAQAIKALKAQSSVK
jgi:hypothetical protein